MNLQPPEGEAARQLGDQPPPMTPAQRGAWIENLETLNQAGFIQHFDPLLGDYNHCNVLQALDQISDGNRIFFQAQKDGPRIHLRDLPQARELVLQLDHGRRVGL